MKRPFCSPRTWFAWLGLACLLLLPAACQRDAVPELPPTEIVQQTAVRLQSASSFHFIIDRSGGPAYVDPDKTISLSRAEGDYQAPDRAQALVRVIAPGLVTEVSVISVAEVQWQTNLLTGAWEVLPPNWGFNPAILFNDEVGLQAILSSGLREVTLAAVAPLPDGPDTLLYHLTAVAAGDRLFRMSGGLIGPADVEVQLWVQPESFELRRVEVTTPGAEPAFWQVDLSDYDQPVRIEPPA